MKVVFTYGDVPAVYQEGQEVNVHVKTAQKRFESMPTLAWVAAVVIALTGPGRAISRSVGTGIFFLILLGAVRYLDTILSQFEQDTATEGQSNRLSHVAVSRMSRPGPS